tara:strand:+ start:2131 stop:2676 length:546 start_codon:yes stop_codon:yes gene_type:complete
MSQLYVDNIKNRTGGAVGFPTGVVVTGVLTATTGNITGNQTVGGNLTVTGNAEVGGVLTYEDVTNIDSVGVVTARSGINIVGGGATVVGVSTFFDSVRVGSAITLGASSGIVTATKFVGDGSELTGVISGIELQFDGSSVGAAVTNINLSGFSSVTAPVAGLSTITVAGWEVRDTWLYGGG